MNNPLTPEYILSEVRKIQYLYGLKREIRYGQKRAADDYTESVAEHIYGMHLLAQYFIPLENQTGDWDRARIFTMITVHDLDEIETGDTISYLKTDEIRAAGEAALMQVVSGAPSHLQPLLSDHLAEYESQATPESRFVKAIDRIEPLFQSYTEAGKALFLHNKQTASQSRRIKEEYLKPFPTMYTYYRTIHETMIAEGFFHPE
jgi:putative hydrolases of HD superfamily